MSLTTCNYGQLLPPRDPPLVGLDDRGGAGSKALVVLILEQRHLADHWAIEIAMTGCFGGLFLGQTDNLEVTSLEHNPSVLRQLYTHEEGPLYVIVDSYELVKEYQSLSDHLDLQVLYVTAPSGAKSIEAGMHGATVLELYV